MGKNVGQGFSLAGLGIKSNFVVKATVYGNFVVDSVFGASATDCAAEATHYETKTKHEKSLKYF